MIRNKGNHKLEWFDKLRLNSWEVEILIVGFVLVMLFQVTGALELETIKISNSVEMLSEDRTTFSFMFGHISDSTKNNKEEQNVANEQS